MPLAKRYETVLKDRDTLSSFILMVFAIWVCYFSKGLALWNSDGPGDGLFPFLGGLALGFFALCLFIQRFLKGEKTNIYWGEIHKLRLLTYIGSLFVYAVVFDWLGSLLATFLFLLFVCKGSEKASWKTSIIISGASTALVFIIFYVLLSVPLPFGLLKLLFFA